MNRPLVSILTPCYNAEPFIERFLDCITNQRYKPIELILINDGSTDMTESLIMSRKQLILESGVQLVYRSQENSGQAKAFNVGLPLVTGTYFTWIDSDDLISSDSIEKKVEYLEKHPEEDCVRSGYRVVNENQLAKTLYEIHPRCTKAGFFEDTLLERTYQTAGTLLIRTKRLFEILPTKQIFETRAGQNWQLVLPISFYCRCGQLNEALFTYVVRLESHSHVRQNDYHYRLKVIENHLEVVQAVLKTLQIDQAKYQQMTVIKYTRRKLILAALFNNKVDTRLQSQRLKALNALTMFDRLIVTFPYPTIVRLLQRVKGIIRP